MAEHITEKNFVISPNFLVSKICRKAQSTHRLRKLHIKYDFPQNFRTRKLGKISGFFAVHVQTAIYVLKCVWPFSNIIHESGNSFIDIT